MASIVPSERLRRELADVVAGIGDEDDPIEAIGRLGARLILQQALEEELSEFLGRERYERRSEPVSYRNGYEWVTVKTTAGPLELERPRLRNASALGFASAVVGKGVSRTHALEALIVCSFLRGLSVRDVEADRQPAQERADDQRLERVRARYPLADDRAREAKRRRVAQPRSLQLERAGRRLHRHPLVAVAIRDRLRATLV